MKPTYLLFTVMENKVEFKLAIGLLLVLMCCIFFSILFSSYVNVQEIKLVMEIIKLIKDKRRDVTFRNIGIITHYKAQKTLIQKDLDKEFDRKGWGIYIFTDISSFSVELKRRRGLEGQKTRKLGPGEWS